ncbi:MAG: hypothetical protein RL559_522 [Pseudomonadota bacterium]|jgi:Tfp pilus assembly protein PilV
MNTDMRAQGMALVEAMVASAVLAIGVLGAARLSLHAQASLRETRALSQAQVLAAQTLGCALAGQSPCPSAAVTVQGGVRYSVTLERSPLSAELQSLQVMVEWAPADGTASPNALRRLRWETRLSGLPGWLGLSSP